MLRSWLVRADLISPQETRKSGPLRGSSSMRATTMQPPKMTLHYCRYATFPLLYFSHKINYFHLEFLDLQSHLNYYGRILDFLMIALFSIFLGNFSKVNFLFLKYIIIRCQYIVNIDIIKITLKMNKIQLFKAQIEIL